MTDDTAKTRERIAQRLLAAAAEPGLPDWLRQALRLAAADPAALESPAALRQDPFNFIYFH